MKKRGLVTALLVATMALATTFTSLAGEWKQDAKGWWYQEDDSSYPTNQWKEIDGKQCFFGADGYMLSNTTTPDGYKVGADGTWIQEEITNTATVLKEGAHFLDSVVTDGNYYYFVENEPTNDSFYAPYYIVRYDMNLSNASRTVLHTSMRFLGMGLYVKDGWVYYSDMVQGSAGEWSKHFIYRLKTDGSANEVVFGLEAAFPDNRTFFIKDGFFYSTYKHQNDTEHYAKINTLTAEVIEISADEYKNTQKQAYGQTFFKGKSYSINNNDLIIRDDITGRETSVKLSGKGGQHGRNQILDINDSYVLISNYKEFLVGTSQISPQIDSYRNLSVYNLKNGSTKEIFTFEKDAKYMALLRDNYIVYFKDSVKAAKLNIDNLEIEGLDVELKWGKPTSTISMDILTRVKIYNSWK